MKKLVLLLLSLSFFATHHTMPMGYLMRWITPQSDPAANANFAQEMGKGLVKGLSESLAQETGSSENANGGLRQATINIVKNIPDALAESLKQGSGFDNLADQFVGSVDRSTDKAAASLGRNADKMGNAATELIGRNADKIVGEATNALKRNADGFTKETTETLQRNTDTFTKESSVAFGKFTNSIRDDAEKAFNKGGDLDRARESTTKWAKRFMTDLGDDATDLFFKSALKVGGGMGLSLLLSMSGWYGSRVLWKWIETELFRPKLLISYDSRGAWSAARDFVKAPAPVTMIFPQELETHVNNIVTATRSIHKKIKGGSKNVKYRNVLLWGPPGTGKTMFAKRLAQESGLAWAHMSGSSFSKFKDGEGIQALDDLMAWANKKNGLLIFIDEAESLIAKREKMDPNSKAYQLLTNFLNYTGERSDKFMLVMATNHKDVIDSAMHRRIDDLVYVPLPEREERMQVLGLYRDKILLDATQNSAEFVASVRDVMTDTKIAHLADRTNGLSNGDLEGIINIIKTDADITDSGLATHEIVEHAVQQGINKQAEFCRSRNVAVGA